MNDIFALNSVNPVMDLFMDIPLSAFDDLVEPFMANKGSGGIMSVPNPQKISELATNEVLFRKYPFSPSDIS